MAPTESYDGAEARLGDIRFKAEIEALIIEEKDPKEKIRLLMMMQLNTTLVDNVVAVRRLTEAFKEHRDEFEDHVAKDDRRESFKRGAVWASIGLLGVMQAMAVFIISKHIDIDEETRKIVMEHTIAIKGLEHDKKKSGDTD